MAGYFVALEGIDGSGKTTIAERLVRTLRAEGRDAIVTREPGGTLIGEEIRSVLFSAAAGAMLPETETLLFAAARAQHVAEVIRPALDRGAIVVIDRFVDSSLAYQSGGRGLSMEAVAAVQQLATSGLEPDLKVLLDVPVEVGLQRRLARVEQANRLDQESLSFRIRVRDAYHQLAAADPDRWRIIDASRSEHEVWLNVWSAVTALGLSAAHHSPGAR